MRGSHGRGFVLAAIAVVVALLLVSPGPMAAGIEVGSSTRGHATGEGRPPLPFPSAPAPAKPARAIPGSGRTLDEPRVVSAATSADASTMSTATRALILYDTSSWAYLGELYATLTANLSGHFGGWVAKPVSGYVRGEMSAYTATIYLGSTYDEPLPTAFLDDTLASTRPVIWANDNIWTLTARAAAAGVDFESRYGWMWTGFLFTDGTYTSPIAAPHVTYRGRVLDRYVGNGSAPLMGVRTTTATVLANAGLADGRTVPWAVRSGNLTYLAEIPFAYMNETDRYLIFADLLFDALAPNTPERHRALVRLEDITPVSDAAKLRAIADFLAAERIPFGFAVSPMYTDGRSSTKLSKSSAKVLAYLVSKGGVLVEHGYTHQWSGGINPYNRTTGDDFEFYRVRENADATLTYVGPLPEDSVSWATKRLTDATALFTKAGLAAPQIFETPHYAGSYNTYVAIGTKFATRWERALYVPGLLSKTVDPKDTRFAGQFFPYVVTDVFGSKVLPENLGNIEPEPWKIYPARQPADIAAAARANLIVRDGFAAFYFHPDYALSYLRETVNLIRSAGYTFADPRTL